MKKTIVMLATAAGLSGCATQQGRQGDPAAVMVGAQVGGMAGAIIGEGLDGYGGSLFGSLIGTVSGALLANAATTPRQEEGYSMDETYAYAAEKGRGYPAMTGNTSLAIRKIRFIDADRNRTIDANETAKIIFEVMNTGRTDVYQVTPVIKELNEVKHLYISPSATIECIPAGDGIRYTANIRTDKKLKDGEALFQITVWEGNRGAVSSRTFSIPTRRGGR